jgi:hypothetical protein
MRRQAKRWIFGLGLLAACGVTHPSEALVRAGAGRPAARVVDAEDRAFELAAVSGRPTLVVYEDKDSATLNAPLKAELSRLARGDRYRSAVKLVPVADVGKYDFWPVRGFVKDAIREESRKIGATIYCDWDGSFARALRIQHGTSTVVLIGKSGRVLFAYEGKPTRERCRAPRPPSCSRCSATRWTVRAERGRARLKSFLPCLHPGAQIRRTMNKP